MIRTQLRKKIFSVENIYFPDESFFNSPYKKRDLTYLSFVKEEDFCCLKNKAVFLEQKTWCTDLSSLSFDSSEIYKSMNETTRNSWNRCKKENIKFVHLDYSSIKNEDIKFLYKTCTEMFKEKKLRGYKPSFSELRQFNNYGCLHITKALKNNNCLSMHAYISNNSCIKLLISCSLFRNAVSDKNEIGRSNRFLHLEDIIFFKNEKFEFLDWGGLFSFDSNNGIDKFKMSFPGSGKCLYNILIPNTYLGRLYCKLKGYKINE